MNQSMTPVQAHPLKPDSFPLHGRRLIEASAGTGKTYTIANLYLRLILGHGKVHGEDSEQGPTAHPEPLTVDQILVVTFTEAATEELRDRIRARINECRMAFIKGQSPDHFIQGLIDSLDQHEKRISLLLAAERQMDESAIFTIHGFCQRMLKQHAFESGTLFSSELIVNESDLLKQAATDFWRKNLYPLNKPLAALVQQIWGTPNQLLIDIQGWLNKHNLKINNAGLPSSLDKFHRDYVQPVIEIKTLWHKDRETLEDLLQNAGLKKNSKPLNRLDQMSAFAQSEELVPVLGRNESWEIYSSATIEKALTKNGEMPSHPVFQMIDQITDKPLPLKEAFRGLILGQALTDIQERHTRQKAEQHQMAFDDLLSNLARSLTAPGGELLAQAIRQQFRVAMIDEFQDTDPKQYSIFNTIYQTGKETEDSAAGLFMIGDPKQAIYAFRGADIFTYMEAREQVAAHYTLGINWRSSSPMIASVNRVFAKNAASFIYEDIPFESVAPSPKADKIRLYNQGEALPALQIWLQDSEGSVVSKGDYEAVMAKSTANEINRLLTDAKNQLSNLQDDEHSQPLQAGDIAVLVRTRQQGKMVREQLAEQNIASVYLSNSDSVFTCQEATDVLRLLSACLQPSKERILKAALATPLLHMTAADLDALSQDEQAWESAVEEFSSYQSTWFNQGVLPMLRTLTSQRKIAEQLLSEADGERRLTDLLHIGELLASASQELESPHALLRWLSERIQSPDDNADEQQLHLESERNLVKVITIHKSKGLEYNVVFLPFACTFKEANDPLYHDGKTKQAILDLTNGAQSKDLADKERLAEDIRLLYVALTRAVHTCYLGVAPLKVGQAGKSQKIDLHKAALGWLLNSGSMIEAHQLPELLDELAQDYDFIKITPPNSTTLPPYQPPAEEELLLEARSFSGHIEKDWWVTSYSALSRSHSSSQPTELPSYDASHESTDVDIEVIKETSSAESTPAEPTITQTEVNQEESDQKEDELSIFNFPKGARPGTFLHSLFEDLDENRLDTYSLTQFATEHLQKEGLEEKWAATLANMLEHCLDAPLDGKAMKLGAIPPSAKKVEMEFYLPIANLRAEQLNRLIAANDPLSAKAGQLDFLSVKGMLKGFIDLVFEYEDRWYVLDYKSNWLGEQLTDYSRENMEQVMIEHRYDLQYQLYSLALHRLLKSRLAGYQYDQHFGGVVYLFLRGVRANDSERHGIYDCRPGKALIEALDQLFAGGEQ